MTPGHSYAVVLDYGQIDSTYNKQIDGRHIIKLGTEHATDAQ